MIRNIIIKKGVIRSLEDRESLINTLEKLQDKFRTDRKIKVVLDEAPIRDEMIGYEELKGGESVEFCSIVDGGSEEFIELLLKEGGKKKLIDSLSSFVKSKYVLYLSIKLDESYLANEEHNRLEDGGKINY